MSQWAFPKQNIGGHTPIIPRVDDIKRSEKYKRGVLYEMKGLISCLFLTLWVDKTTVNQLIPTKIATLPYNFVFYNVNSTTVYSIIGQMVPDTEITSYHFVDIFKTFRLLSAKKSVNHIIESNSPCYAQPLCLFLVRVQNRLDEQNHLSV